MKAPAPAPRAMCQPVPYRLGTLRHDQQAGHAMLGGQSQQGGQGLRRAFGTQHQQPVMALGNHLHGLLTTLVGGGGGIAQGQQGSGMGGRSVQHHIGGVELVQLQIGKLAALRQGVATSLLPYPAMTRRSQRSA